MEFDYYSWIILPLLIFLARVLDVSISTLRMLMVMSGRKNVAPLLGAIEVTIWLLAITQILQNMNNVATYFGYAAGFATGTYIGMRIEERLALGNYVIRIITDKASSLVENLRKAGYPTICIKGEGNRGETDVIFLIIKRKEFVHVVELINLFNPQALYTVASIKHVNEGGFAAPNAMTARGTFLGRLYGVFKKSK